MPWRYHIRLMSLTICFWLAAHVVQAQENVIEFWPEIDTWLRLSPRWRFSVFVPISKNIETHYREGNFIAQVDYAFGKSHFLHVVRLNDDSKAQSVKPFLLRVGYLGAKSLNDRGEAYNENMGYLEFHLRNPLKGGVLVSHRLRSEMRWIGDDNELSYRVRYRLMIEKEISRKKMSWVPYVNVEPYYDSRYETVNRVRAIGGTTVTWSPRLMLEGNVTYQHDSRSSVTNLYALNLILHLFFERHNQRQE